MYFTVKYIDLKTFKEMKDVDPINNALEEDEDLTVKNKKLAVNPDCFIGVIMDYIFEEVGIDNRANFDIMTSHGKLLNVQNYAPDFSGLNIFEDRKEYYVAYRNKEKVRPLLSKTSQEYLDLTESRKKKPIASKKSNSGTNTLKTSSRVKGALE